MKKIEVHNLFWLIFVADTIPEEPTDIEIVPEDTFDMIDLSTPRPNLPPFPEVAHLNLSHNKVRRTAT